MYKVELVQVQNFSKYAQQKNWNRAWFIYTFSNCVLTIFALCKSFWVDRGGRVAMIATMGYIMPEIFRFPGCEAGTNREWPFLQFFRSSLFSTHVFLDTVWNDLHWMLGLSTWPWCFWVHSHWRMGAAGGIETRLQPKPGCPGTEMMRIYFSHPLCEFWGNM